MSVSLEKGLFEGFNYLQNLVTEKVQPKAARSLLGGLRERHPNINMDLLFQEEPYDRTIHYDLLLHEVGEGSVSLSFCPEHTLPWPLRGAHSSREQDLVKVNELLITVGDAIAQIDFIWNEQALATQIINQGLIFQELQENPIDLTDAELQAAMNDFRILHKLFTASTTQQWMKERGLTHDRFEVLVQDYASVAKLRKQVTAESVKAYFQQHQSTFESAQVAYVILSDWQSTQIMFESITQQKVSFFAALEIQLASNSKHIIEQSLLERSHYQDWPFPKDAVFASASIGEVLDPVKTEKGFALIKVIDRIAATLTPDIEIVIQDLLFQEWLASKRQEASVEWYWG
jgi:putative peptide maturation system protein